MIIASRSGESSMLVRIFTFRKWHWRQSVSQHIFVKRAAFYSLCVIMFSRRSHKFTKRSICEVICFSCLHFPEKRYFFIVPGVVVVAWNCSVFSPTGFRGIDLRWCIEGLCLGFRGIRAELSAPWDLQLKPYFAIPIIDDCPFASTRQFKSGLFWLHLVLHRPKSHSTLLEVHPSVACRKST